MSQPLIDWMLFASNFPCKKQNTSAVGIGVIVSEYQTNTSPADYIIPKIKKLVDVIEAKREGGVRRSIERLISDACTTPTSLDKAVNKNFHEWIFKKQAGTLKYTEEQVWGLRMIKDYIANSFHVDRDDFELDPFNKQGGLGKMWQLFGEQTDEIIELNKRLVA